MAVGTRVGVRVIVGIGVKVEVGLAACVCAKAVWIAWGDGEQAVRKIIIMSNLKSFPIYPQNFVSQISKVYR